MIAFHEAILGYSRERGAFLKYAALLIRSRLTDAYRKEKRHQGHLSLDESGDEDDRTLLDQLADSRDLYAQSHDLEATQQEIAELAGVLQLCRHCRPQPPAGPDDGGLSGCHSVCRAEPAAFGYAAANQKITPG